MIRKPAKPKICPCGTRFTPMRRIQKYCSGSCEMKYKTGDVDEANFDKLSWSTLYQMATGAFQAARRKALEPKCYTCGRETKPLHCGHAFKKEIYRGMIFDEDTTRIQCDLCNVGLDGNIEEFHRRLKAEHGEVAWELIKQDAEATKDHKWSRIELIEKYKQYHKPTA